MAERREIGARLLWKLAAPLAVLTLAGLAWQALAASGLFLDTLLPGPVEVLRGIAALARSGALARDAGASLLRVLAGFTLATAVAVPLGILLGWYRRGADAVVPLLDLLRTVSPLAWIPLAVLWFGIGEKPAIFIIFMAALFPTLVATMHARRQIDPALVKTAVNLGARDGALLRTVIFPASLPSIMVGARISLGIAWIVIVAAEMVGMQSGLGHLILDARNFLRTDLVIAGMLIVGVIGFVLDRGMAWLERRLQRHLRVTA